MAAAEPVVCGRSSRTNSRRVASVRIYVASSLPVGSAVFERFALPSVLQAASAHFLKRGALALTLRPKLLRLAQRKAHDKGQRTPAGARYPRANNAEPAPRFWLDAIETRAKLPGVSERLDSIDTGAHRPPRPTVSGVPGAADRGLRMWKEHMSDASTDITAPELSNSPQ